MNILITNLKRECLLGVILASTLLSSISFVHAQIPFENGSVDEIITAIDNAVAQKTKDKGVIQSLATSLLDDETNVKVKERSAWALGELEAKNQTPTLIKAARHKGLLVRSAALNALIHLRARAALQVFIDIAENDPVLLLRQRATIGLGLLQWEKTIQPLVKLSEDPKEEIRGAAALSMANTQSKKNDFSEALKEMKADASPYVQDRAKVGLDIVSRKNKLVQPHLKSPDVDIRLMSAVYYQYHGHSTDLKMLSSLVGSENDEEVLAQLKKSVTVIKKRATKSKKNHAKPPTQTSTDQKSGN